MAADILVSDSFCLFHYDQVMWGEKKELLICPWCPLFSTFVFFKDALFFFFHFNGALLK